jgi:hypothetical protein
MLRKLSYLVGIIVGTAAVLAHIISFQRSCEPFPMGQCIYQWIAWATAKQEDTEALAKHQKAQQAKEEAREAAAIAKAKADQAEAEARAAKAKSDEADRKRRVDHEAEMKKEAELQAQQEAARKLAATRAEEQAEQERRVRQREEEERRRLVEIQRREAERRQIEEERQRKRLAQEAEIASKTRWCETCCNSAFAPLAPNSRPHFVNTCVSRCLTGGWRGVGGTDGHCFR